MTDDEIQRLKDKSFNDDTERQELYDKRVEIRRLATMLVRSAGGIAELQWVDVLGREILKQSREPGDS